MPGVLETEVENLIMQRLVNRPGQPSTFEAAITPRETFGLGLSDTSSARTVNYALDLAAGAAKAVAHLARHLDEMSAGANG